MEMQNIYRNFDGLDMAFHGAISDETAQALDQAKAAAQAAGDPVAVEIGGVLCRVRETGRRGGFQWVLDTGEEGEDWAIKAPRAGDDRGAWAVSVSAKSAAFVQYGDIFAIRDRIAARLAAWGWTATRCPESGNFDSVARVDFAMDFEPGEGFALDPGAVTSKGSKTGYLEGATAHWSGRRVTGCTIGKMPNRQVCIYDKTADIAAKGKAYWWKVWAAGGLVIEDEDKPPRVWRVELRAGKRFLRETWGIKNFDDLAASVGDVMADTLDKVRLVDPVDSNVTRCPDAPLWGRVRAVVAKGLSGLFSGLCPGAVKETVRERADIMLRQMLRGVALTHGALMAGRPDLSAVREIVQDVAEGVLRQFETEPDAALDHVNKALSRYRMIEADRWNRTHKPERPRWLGASTISP